MNEKLLQLYTGGQVDEMLTEMENYLPRDLLKFWGVLLSWIEKNIDLNHYEDNDPMEYLHATFTEEQWKKLHYLNSSERTEKMIKEKAEKYGEEALTDEDWFDLRATDF